MATEKPTLVIGDIHGHHDRLEALLRQEGLLDYCSKCDGIGEVMPADDEWKDCENCFGNGWARTDKDALVITLGDLGHFGLETMGNDFDAYQRLNWGWIDVALWGNHDRAVVDRAHAFGGYSTPAPETLHLMRILEAENKLQMAYAVHGFLLTHAGLHAQWKYTSAPDGLNKDNVYEVADYLNSIRVEREANPVIDAVGQRRGGISPFGGILWRDITEKLYPLPQVFGHSADRQHVVRSGETKQYGAEEPWYCIDIGGKGGQADRESNCLAGIWLPEETIVRVDYVGVPSA